MRWYSDLSSFCDRSPKARISTRNTPPNGKPVRETDDVGVVGVRDQRQEEVGLCYSHNGYHGGGNVLRVYAVVRGEIRDRRGIRALPKRRTLRGVAFAAGCGSRMGRISPRVEDDTGELQEVERGAAVCEALLELLSLLE
ncbi:hypothetical protein BU17DRAFT_60114 [Hysterangium stoloniferum]|nr:hypothetical protein BU17DRAFT_60114 [Hysterangium stoloniferum]